MLRPCVFVCVCACVCVCVCHARDRPHRPRLRCSCCSRCNASRAMLQRRCSIAQFHVVQRSRCGARSSSIAPSAVLRSSYIAPRAALQVQCPSSSAPALELQGPRHGASSIAPSAQLQVQFSSSIAPSPVLQLQCSSSSAPAPELQGSGVKRGEQARRASAESKRGERQIWPWANAEVDFDECFGILSKLGPFPQTFAKINFRTGVGKLPRPNVWGIGANLLKIPKHSSKSTSGRGWGSCRGRMFGELEPNRSKTRNIRQNHDFGLQFLKHSYLSP